MVLWLGFLAWCWKCCSFAATKFCITTPKILLMDRINKLSRKLKHTQTWCMRVLIQTTYFWMVGKQNLNMHFRFLCAWHDICSTLPFFKPKGLNVVFVSMTVLQIHISLSVIKGLLTADCFDSIASTVLTESPLNFSTIQLFFHFLSAGGSAAYQTAPAPIALLFFFSFYVDQLCTCWAAPINKSTNGTLNSRKRRERGAVHTENIMTTMWGPTLKNGDAL